MKQYRISYWKRPYGRPDEQYHETKKLPFSSEGKAQDYYEEIKQNAKKGLNPFGNGENDVKYWYEFTGLMRIDVEEETTKIA